MKNQSRSAPFPLRARSAEVSALLKQLAHPARLAILCAIAAGEKSVGAIEEACGASQSAVSQYLRRMRLEGMVEARRDGKRVHYRIADPRIASLIRALYRIFCR